MIRYSHIDRLGLQITFRKEFSLMKLTQLEYFCAAVECQSITAAAKKLYVTQPAISGAIRELEKEFSVTLFSHARNKMALTEDGRLFYERVEQLLQEVESTAQELHDLGSAQQTVKVGIPPLWGTTFFPDLLHDFNAMHPNIRLVFYEYGSARAAALVKEKVLDIALANLDQDDPESFQSVCIGRDHFVIVVAPSHPLATRESLSLEDLSDISLVMYNTDSIQNKAILSRFSSLGITPNAQLYSSQIYTMKSMLHNSPCAGFFYASLLQDHPDLVGIPIEPPIEQRVGLLWRKQKYTPSCIEAFISFVKDYPLFPEEP